MLCLSLLGINRLVSDLPSLIQVEEVHLNQGFFLPVIDFPAWTPAGSLSRKWSRGLKLHMASPGFFILMWLFPGGIILAFGETPYLMPYLLLQNEDGVWVVGMYSF